ncbi:methyl-accepting chemotaxis sensory transducer with Cache sensor [Orenia metallireducens]|uniref:Methyl-accepting chemotaxis sensory transducer with Cache sensor n=1 Tax=Orenia metallireducens TaxID=1413210 RepID=A0A285HD33_9FIRM|nr:methyl-accepting chemotaxis protein [Orenia metallireducens]PRX27723.1 methyl-accepting chemotaxis sensory transducer with Cache sensor [Orenia metallireducens]SNY33640.1 methyl-accepting chemotaxis sensory transducer with Cache sensor [Orenia metallireducens]
MRFFNRTILIKFLVPTLFMIILATTIVGVMGYNLQKNTLNDLIKDRAELKIEEVKVSIDERSEDVEITKKALNKYLIMLTKMVAEAIKDVPESRLNEELTEIASYLNIPEVHIIDEEGVLQWTNIPGFIGFNFNSSEQTRPFLEGLNNKNFSLAQEPQKRGVDQTLFQYVGVARQDKKGIVQIGVKPEELQELVGRIDIGEITKRMKFGQEGYIFITNLAGKIISHPDNALIGKKITEYDWGQKVLKQGSGHFLYTFNKQEKLMYFDKYDGYIIAVTIPISEYLGSLASFREIILFTTIICIILAIIIIYFIVKSIIKRINLAVDFSNEIAEGNLKVEELEIKGEDEIAKLSKSLNKMREKLKGIIVDLLNDVEDLSAYSEELSASAEEGNATIETTNQLVEDMAASIQEISASAQQVTGLAQESNSQTQVGSRNIEDTLASMKAINQSVKDSRVAINELDLNSQEIGTIVEIIDNIAEQTNLLALNAAIEAARAGEYGQGFAVVADEIRELATETSKAIDDINKLVKETQQKSKLSLAAIKEVDIKAQEGMEVAKRTGEVFVEIQSSSEQTTAHIQQTAAATEQLAQKSDQVMTSSNDIGNMSEEITNSSQQLATMAQKLQSLVDNFKV